MAVDYHRYMASRDWALKREAVKTRADNVCERCLNAPIQNVHHLTYERLGNENADTDLQGVCRPCHQYLSAKLRRDPAETVFRGLLASHGLKPFNFRDQTGTLAIAFDELGETDSGIAVGAHLYTYPIESKAGVVFPLEVPSNGIWIECFRLAW